MLDMDLFGLKKKKAEKEEALRQAAADARKEKEIQTRISIRKRLNSFRTLSTKLDKSKGVYIAQAKNALLINDKLNYNTAKKALKLCVSKQKMVDRMTTHFEIAIEMAEMNKVINEFIGGMNLIADEIKSLSSDIDITKAQNAYAKAIANNETQMEALDAFMEEAEGSIEAFNGDDDSVSDAEIDKMINNDAADSESEAMDELDQKIDAIRQKMSTKE